MQLFSIFWVLLTLQHYKQTEMYRHGSDNIAHLLGLFEKPNIIVQLSLFYCLLKTPLLM